MKNALFKAVSTLICVLLSMGVSAEQTVSPLTVKLHKNQLVIQRDTKELVRVKDILLNFYSFDNIEQLTTNNVNHYRFKLSYNNVVARQEVEKTYDRELILNVNATDAGLHFTADADWFLHVNLILDDLGGHMFGVKQTLEPYNQRNPDLRGLVQDINAIGEENRFGANYATAVSPMFFNSKGYVSFFNTFAEGRYQFAINGQSDLFHTTSKIDWHILNAPTLDSALENYFKIIGKPKSVPAWATGPVIWRDDYRNGAKDIMNDVKTFTELRMPFTGLFIDRPYSNGAHRWAEMDFNDQFANPEQWAASLNDDYNVALMTWIASATFGDKTFPGRMEGTRSYFDLTNDEAVAEFKRRLETFQYSVGVQGHKMDRADEYFDRYQKWNDGTPLNERRSKYLYLYAKVTDEILRDTWGEDQFNFARAAVHGSQQYLSAIWAGDVMTNWDGLANNIANSIRASYQGFPNWGTDVGGYIGRTGRISEDLYLRWMQFGLWTGFFEIKLDGAGGHGEDRVPWRYSETFQDNYRRVLDERMALMPYIHSLLNTSATEGTLMKPLAGLYPNDKNTYAIWDQYLFGPSFLVAPVYSTDNSRDVYLPDGLWTDFYTGERYKGKQTITVALDDAYIPTFVKADSLIVLGNIYQGNDVNWTKAGSELTAKLFLSKDKKASGRFTFLDANNGDKAYDITWQREGNNIRVNSGGLPYDLQIELTTAKGTPFKRAISANSQQSINIAIK